jgi:UDP-glucose 4-epimerase
MPKSIVTGGAGFIGSHMAHRLLKEGHDVLVIDSLVTGKRSRVPADAGFVKADVCWDHDMNKAFEEFQPDYVFHFAAQIDVRHSVIDPLADCEVNTVATVNLLEAARNVDVKRFLFASSGGAVYGGTNPPYTEKSPCRPKSPYGMSKYAAEGYIDLYRRLHDLSATTLRLANVYGPGQDGSGEAGVVAIFNKAFAEEKQLVIYGDGYNTRDFVHVHDVCSAFVAAANADQSGTFNIGTGRQTEINDLGRLLAKWWEMPFDPIYEPAREGEERVSAVDCTLANVSLSWSPTIKLEDGIDSLNAFEELAA